MRPVLLSLVSLVLLPMVAACSDSKSVQTVTWALSVEESASRAEAGNREAVRKRFDGISVVLELRSDNSFTLTVTGGPDAQTSTGTYKSGYDAIFLYRTARDGKPVAEADRGAWRLRSPAGKLIEVELSSMLAVLTRR
jgi:hypothetical protein